MSQPPAPNMQEIMSDPKKMAAFFAQMPEAFWMEKGKEAAIAAYNDTLENVEGYKSYLKDQGIGAAPISSYEEFVKLPSTSKESYLTKYPLAKRFYKGLLSRSYSLSTSSGTTGKPQYWPRLHEMDTAVPVLVELMYQMVGLERKTTLLINALAQGTWSASNLMTDATLQISRKGSFQMGLITPGPYVKLVLEIVRDLGDEFDQTFILAYPPTARSIIIKGIEEGIDWNKHQLKILSGGDPVTESWKNFILEKIGSKRRSDIMPVFGMSEVGVLAFETPLAQVIAKILYDDPELCLELTGSHSLAALMQYNPLGRWIEVEDGELVLTAKGAIPLIRYKSHDLGGIFSYSDLLEKVGKKHDVMAELKKAGFKEEDIWKWPFFFSTGRGDAVSIMGANIFPSDIEEFFHKNTSLNHFKLAAEKTDSEQVHLHIYLEICEGKTQHDEDVKAMAAVAEQDILELLKKNNTDFLDGFQEEPESMIPLITICDYNTGPFTEKKSKLKYIVS